MKVCILCSRGFEDYRLISATMEKLIQDSQCYLFTVVCGSTENKMPIGSLSEIWAKNNGAPINYIIEPSIDKLIDKIADSADFIVAFYNGEDVIVRRVIMKMKGLGKHGKVVNI